jgi:hypothetical protein
MPTTICLQFSSGLRFRHEEFLRPNDSIAGRGIFARLLLGCQQMLQVNQRLLAPLDETLPWLVEIYDDSKY